MMAEPSPIAVGLPLTKLVAPGDDHTCAALVDGTTWCWGKRDVGQVGNNTTDLMPELVPVQTLLSCP
jgi:alpha-tubulin suppressor-like RCC1 family protein